MKKTYIIKIFAFWVRNPKTNKKHWYQTNANSHIEVLPFLKEIGLEYAGKWSQISI